MLASEDASRTLQSVFEADFYPALGISKETLDPAIDVFYDNVFPELRRVTKTRPGARELVDWALANGCRVAIATDPLFPRKAVYHRIRWAGLEPERFDLVSSFETFHFSKSHPAYFAEVLGRLGWPEGPVLMVGNDLERDLTPAQQLGLVTYHVDGKSASVSAGEPARRGDLIMLRSLLENSDFAQFQPAFRERNAILSVLESTPAVLQSLTLNLSRESWSTEPSPHDWAMVELICHLRDTEREVHRMQIATLQQATHPFVPRPDAAVWAKQRNYLDEDGPAALRDFATARRDILEELRGLDESIWSRAARHAIFGPTDFREVVGFIADHDRLHIQQAFKTLRAL